MGSARWNAETSVRYCSALGTLAREGDYGIGFDSRRGSYCADQGGPRVFSPNWF